VDDEPRALEAVAEMLASEGHAVDAVASGAEALERFDPESHSLVITDQAMPEMSGTQLAVALRRRAPRLPILLLTGFGDMVPTTGEGVAEVDMILSKPATLAELRRAVARVVGGKADAGQNG
jgi:CheY-like chemotaxis protein